MNDAFLKSTFGLEGRTALVTGSARGIGRSIALALGQAGARVVINDLDAQRCHETADAFRAAGITADIAAFDVSDRDAVLRARDALDQRGWSIDILVSNAGNQNRKPLAEATDEDWQSILNVHLGGALHGIQAFVPGMVARGFGRVVLTASVSAVATMPGIAPYSTAKAALAALARAVAVEHGGHGVTANAIAPGFVRTEFTTGLQQREGFEQYLTDNVPAGRWATPEDIAPAVLYLASPGASFVNGHLLVIDGGLLARL